MREIAAIAGVSERTIYKYVAKGGWKQRYRRVGFAPVKGAGARFIRREDKDTTVARGLKATDPAAAKRATASCRVASRLSARAEANAKAEAEADAAFENWMVVAQATNELLRTIREHGEVRARLKLPASNDAAGQALMRALGHSLDGWEAAAADMQCTRDAPPFMGRDKTRM